MKWCNAIQVYAQANEIGPMTSKHVINVCSRSILLTRHNEEIAQLLPDPFHHERLGLVTSAHGCYSMNYSDGAGNILLISKITLIMSTSDSIEEQSLQLERRKTVKTNN